MTGGALKPTPLPIGNRPGLGQIATRAGTHSSFLQSLTRGLADANRPGLAELRSRAGGDITLGLLDAWAAVADTLEFYGERSANEAYLGTATERGSLRAHARLIGYELAAAKAASVHLAFIAEPANAPDVTLAYDPGLQVRSIPRDGEKPQLFETTEPLTARAEWNAMRPRLSFPQLLTADTDTMTLTAGEPRVSVGDPILFLQGAVPLAFADAVKPGFLRRISSLLTARDGSREVLLSPEPTGTPPYRFLSYPLVLNWSPPTVSTTTLQAEIPTSSWSISGLSTLNQQSLITPLMLTSAITALPALPDPVGPALPALMQVAAGCFGNTAISHPNAPFDPSDIADLAAAGIAVPGAVTATQVDTGDTAPPPGHVYIYLDREHAEIVAGQTVLLRDAFKEGWGIVLAAEKLAVEAYGSSAKVTRIEIAANVTGPAGPVAISGFLTRKTTVFAAPRPLALAALKITADIGAASGDLGADQIELAGPDLALFPGKSLAITGERSDLVGVYASEIKTVADNTLNGGFSVLTLTQPLAYSYRRDTVTLNANLAEATHGETVSELLGDGDAAIPFLTVTLKSKPLTYVSAKTASGMAPALVVQVDAVVWDLIDDFRDAGPEDRVFILRIAEDQTARIIFGDGTAGQRPATGLGNITATYRKGAGSDGMLEAGQLSLLVTKPQGLKGVSNPLPPAAAADAEAPDDARRNAPLKVLTLGRVVSLRDYQDMARSFAGIAKARADWTFDGFNRPIYVTVAGQGGAILAEGGTDLVNLRDTLRASGEADISVFVRNYQPVGFAVAARLYIDPAYDTDTVLAAGLAALALAFGFDARSLGQGVSHAGVIAVLQDVAGVTGVDLDLLYRIGHTPSRQPRLTAAAASPDLGGAIPVPAELLTIDMVASSLQVAT